MADLSPDLGPQILAACQAAQGDVAGSLSSALDATLEANFSTACRLASELADALAGPGLVVELRGPGGAIAFVLPESSGLLPPWYRAPDPTGASKLATLAQELSMQVLPDSWPADDFSSRAAADLQAEFSATFAAQGATGLACTLKTADRTGQALLLWPFVPAAAPAAAASAAPSPAPPAPVPPAPAAPAAPARVAAQAPPRSASGGSRAPASPARRPRRIEDLPTYARSLLRVRVPVCVKLAERKQPVSRILEIAPGAILQFDKSCHEMLDLQVGDRSIAQGEAVKIGDKFGLRIAHVILPEEQFHPVRKR